MQSCFFIFSACNFSFVNRFENLRIIILWFPNKYRSLNRSKQNTLDVQPGEKGDFSDGCINAFHIVTEIAETLLRSEKFSRLESLPIPVTQFINILSPYSFGLGSLRSLFHAIPSPGKGENRQYSEIESDKDEFPAVTFHNDVSVFRGGALKWDKPNGFLRVVATYQPPGPENPDIQVSVMAVVIYRIEKFLYL